jgi:hypothetical protein
VNWNAPSSNGGTPVTGYQIYRGTAAGSGSGIVIVAPGTTTFLDTTVTRKVKYFYRITALNSVGEGPPSVEVNPTAR